MRQLGCRQGTGKELRSMERAFTLRLLPLTLQSCLCLALCPIDLTPKAGPHVRLLVELAAAQGCPTWLTGAGTGWGGPAQLPHSPVRPVAPQCTAGGTQYSVRLLISAVPKQGP